MPNEKLTAEQRKPVAYFVFHHGKWLLINQTLPGLKDVTANKPAPPGQALELTDGQEVLLSAEDGGRLLHIPMVKA